MSPARKGFVRPTAVAAVAVLLAAALAGCSGDDGDPEEVELPQTLMGPGADIVNDVTARADVSVLSCEPDDEAGESWTVTGEATNSTDAAVVYRFAVRFASPADGSVLGREAYETAAVAPGETVSIEVTGELEEPATELNCIFAAIAREPVE